MRGKKCFFPKMRGKKKVIVDVKLLYSGARESEEAYLFAK